MRTEKYLIRQAPFTRLGRPTSTDLFRPKLNLLQRHRPFRLEVERLRLARRVYSSMFPRFRLARQPVLRTSPAIPGTS